MPENFSSRSGNYYDYAYELVTEIKKYGYFDVGAACYPECHTECDSLEKDMADAALFAFSSDWEGLPNALMEAMALGLPIVATDCPCGGPRTIMTNEVDGLLIPIKDQKALEDGINRLIEDRPFAEKLGREARKIADKANGEAVYEQWRDYIEELCTK